MKVRNVKFREYEKSVMTLLNDIDNKLLTRAESYGKHTVSHVADLLYISDKTLYYYFIEKCFRSYKMSPNKNVIRYRYKSFHKDFVYFASHVYDKHEMSITLKFHMKSTDYKKVKISEVKIML